MLAKSLGVKEIVILVNKMDEASVEWSEDRFEEIRGQLLKFLRDYCEYPEQNIHWLPYSGFTGENMMTGIKNPKGSWYKGPTMFELFDQLPTPERDNDGPLRFPIFDKYKDGTSLYAFGKVESGTMVHSKMIFGGFSHKKIGSKLTLMPSGDQVTIQAIYDNADKRVPYAKAGEGVKVLLKGIEDDYVNIGDIICSNHSFCYVCNEFEAEIFLTHIPKHKSIMSTGYACVMHLHAAMEEVFIKEIKCNGMEGLSFNNIKIAEYSKSEGKFNHAKYLKKGSKGIVVISTRSIHPICCEKADTMAHLGKFTLRDEGK